jgi:hypothetical protein
MLRPSSNKPSLGNHEVTLAPPLGGNQAALRGLVVPGA